ncbi:MAG TPA: tetratricopeptide repeat protein, partial [Stellaceae bacterium]|nr:tetratricopeptide repeat protein [Stellaceae bacterium]
MDLRQLVGTGFQALEARDFARAEACFAEAMRMAPGQPAVHFGIGMLRFQEGNYAEALEPLAQAADAGIALPDSWRYFCHALAMLGRDQDLAGALRAGLPPPVKLELAFQIFTNRMAAGDHDGIARLSALLPPEDSVRMAGAFWQALVLADSDDLRSTSLFKQAHNHAIAFLAAGHQSEIIETRLGICDAMENDAYVWAPVPPGADALNADALNADDGAMEMLCTGGVADPALGVVFAACDGSYFETFAADCATSLAALGPGRTLHVHVVNPGPGTMPMMERLRSDNPSLALRFSIERTVGIGGAVYYACARFLRLGAILDRYRVPVLMTDIDGLFGPESARLPDAAQGVDLAYFRVDTVLPWLQCH